MRVRFVRQVGHLGDMIRCFSAARAIKTACPDAEVWFYLSERCAEEASWCPHIDRVVVLDGKLPHVRHKITNPDELPFLRSAVKFDATVNLLGLAHSYVKRVAPRVQLDQIEIFTAAAEEATGLPLVPVAPVLTVNDHAIRAAEDWLAQKGFSHGRPLVALQPHGAKALCRFSPDQFEALVRGLADHVSLVVLGFSPELKRAANMGALVGVRIPKTVLLGLMKLCDLVFGVDSGLFHMAGAVSTPALVVLGATGGGDLGRHYPLASWIEAGQSEREGLSCSGPCYCYAYRKQLAICKKSFCQAMIRIPPDRIISVVLERLGL